MGLILAPVSQFFLLLHSETLISISDTNWYIQQFFTLFTFLLCIDFNKKRKRFSDNVTFVQLNFSFLKLLTDNSCFDKQRNKRLDCYFTPLGDCPLLLKLLNIYTKWQTLTLQSNTSTPWINCWGCPRDTGLKNQPHQNHHILSCFSRKTERKKLISTRSILKRKYSILALLLNPFCKRILRSCF